MVDSCTVSKVNTCPPTGFYLAPPSGKHLKFQLEHYSLPVTMFFKHLIVIDIYSMERESESWAFDRKEEDTRFLGTRGEKREK